jgi:hypothetical protein
MSLPLFGVLGVCAAYLALAFYLYRTTPRVDELEARDRLVGSETCFKQGRSDAPIKRYPLYTGPELRTSYRQTLGIVLDSPFSRSCASWLVGAFLLLVTPIRHAVFFQRKTHFSKRSAVPLRLFNRLTTHVFGSASQLINAVTVLEDDARNDTLETRAASLITGTLTFWRNLKNGDMVNLTRGLRSETSDARYLFTRCSGLHDLSRRSKGLMWESTDLEPEDYVVVFIRGTAWRLDVIDGGTTEEGRRRLLEDLVAIVRDSQSREQPTEPGLSLCTHVYDERQMALRATHRDYFETINRALFVVSLFPELRPESINDLATEHFGHPESCWHDKGFQLFVYGNGKASGIGRVRNYVFGSAIVKSTSYVGQEAGKHDFSALLGRLRPDTARPSPIAHPVLDEREREVLRFYREQHTHWVRKAPHIAQARVGRRSFRQLGGTKIHADSIVQICLHAAYTKVFGRFPISAEALYMGYFQGLYGGAMDLCGTREMKVLAERLSELDPGGDVPRERLSADGELARLLREAVESHRLHMLFARQGFVTPGVLVSWFRSFAFTPLLLGAVLWACFVPRRLQRAAPFRWLAFAFSRIPLLSRLLAFELVDIGSSHLPAVPGVSASAIMNLCFDKLPGFFSPELFLPEKVAGVFRPRLLVHYSVRDEHVNYSPLCFSPEAVPLRERFIQAVDFYLRVCASMCEPVPAHVGNPSAPVKTLATG